MTSELADSRDGDLIEKINQYFWWHSIELRDGIVTPGKRKLALMEYYARTIFNPVVLHGKSVLDIGAWNGGFTIEACRRGASSVLAVDHYTWNSKNFRGVETFDLAVRESGVTGVKKLDQDMDVPQLSLAHLGRFDVVLFLGVFYHLKDPLAALRELAAITSEVLVLETHVVHTEDPRPLMVYYPGRELANDGSNWWGPNPQCVVDLLRTNGFKRVTHVDVEGESKKRGIFHAWK